MDTVETFEASAKAIVAAIPMIGGSITSFWDSFQSAQIERKIERINEMVYELGSTIDSWKANINSEYISKNDCPDLFEKTIQFVVNERIKEKRIGFRNIFINSLIAENCDFDRTEKFLKLLDQMSNIDIILLRTFYDPISINKQRGEPIKHPFLDENGDWKSSYSIDYSLLEIIIKLHSFTKREIEDSLYYLYQNRLIIHHIKTLKTNGNPIDIFENILTERGTEFIKFIIDPLE